jgi:hypothetical protein
MRSVLMKIPISLDRKLFAPCIDHVISTASPSGTSLKSTSEVDASGSKNSSR